MLALIPRDRHRYAFELHLDDETALPLPVVADQREGQLLERFQFISLASFENEDGCSRGRVQAGQLRQVARWSFAVLAFGGCRLVSS